MPVISVALNDLLLGRLKSNLKEVQARGGGLYDADSEIAESAGVHHFAPARTLWRTVADPARGATAIALLSCCAGEGGGG